MPSPQRSEPPAAERFPFLFDPWLAPVAALFGIRPSNAHATVGDAQLTIRFGRWSLRTQLGNVRAVTATGPYSWWKVAGPPHLSFADRGVTFATTAAQGLCIAFHEPVPALLPTGALRHPAATVTLASPNAFTEALAHRTSGVLPAGV
ncbi:MAG TPA: hypothetical protein VFZ77_11565 [Acidimicrobiales bacterium]